MSDGGGGGGMFSGLFEGIGGWIGGRNAEKKMDKYQKYMLVMLKKEFEKSQKLWELYQQLYIPLQTGIVSEAQAPAEQQPGFAQSMADLNRGYSTAATNMQRTMAGRYPYGSGLEAEGQKNLAMALPKAKSDVWNQYNAQRFNKMMQAMGIGAGMPSTSIASDQAMAGTFSNLMSMFAQMANQNFNKSASGFGSFTDQLVSMGTSGMGGGGGGKMSFF